MPLRRAITVRVLTLFCAGTVLMTFAPRWGFATELTQTLEFPRDRVRLDAGAVPSLSGPHVSYTSGAGLPVLPYRVVNVLLPDGEVLDDYDIETDAATTLSRGYDATLAGYLVSSAGERVPGDAIAHWSEDRTVFPSSSIRYLGTGYLHGRSIASFAVYPIHLDGGDLRLDQSMTLRVSTRAGTPDTDVVRRERFRDGFRHSVRRQLERHVVNPEVDDTYVSGAGDAKRRGGFQPSPFPSLEGSPVDYVIVTNDSMSATFQALADWKTAKGVPTVVRSTEWIEANTRNGVDLAETIRNFVVEAYAKWGITYVLIGGDSDLVPSRQGGSMFIGERVLPVDMYFGCLDGDWNEDHDALFGEPGPSADDPDLYQEVYTGRLPAGSIAEAQLLINKVIDYETPVEPDYMERILFLSEVLFPIDWEPGRLWTQDGGQLSEDVIALAMTNPALDVVRNFQNYTVYPGAVEETVQSTIDSLNAGYNFVTHIGHGFRFNMSVGNGDFTNRDADALINGARQSNCYLLNCTGLAYTFYCIGEHLLKNPAGGAVSCVGASESAFPAISQLYMNEYFDLVFNQDVVNIGQAVARSRLPRTPLAELGDNADSWTHYIYTVLADPEMPLFTGPVETFNVSHVSSVGLGTSVVEVTVTDGGGPVESAVVCLSKGSDDYQVAETDVSGVVNLVFTAESPGDISIVVTGLNHARHESVVSVSQPSVVHLSYESLVVDDDSTSGTSGNGDNTIDAGEVVDLAITMANHGDIASGNVTLIVQSASPGVTILDANAAVGVVPPGGTAAASDPVRVMLASSIADETVISFQVEILEDGLMSRFDQILKEVHAPEFEFVTLRIDDSLLGNDDGVNQDNEEFYLFYGVKNFGTGSAYGLSAELTDLDGAFVFVDSVDGYPEIPSFSSSENIAGFRLLEPDASTPHNLQLTVTDALSRQWSVVFELRPPPPPANIVVDPSLGSDRLSIEWDPSTSPDVTRFNVYRSEAPGGPYDRANTDPVGHSMFVNTGLMSTTRYYYVLTAVDTSGNESAATAEFSGSTNPSQVEGWPITMMAETVSSPVIGDIDGDQDFEIVQGNEKLYAWHHNGVEMIDGDGNSQTWGLLTTQGNAFVSPVALAELDAVPGYDIIAGSRDTKEVYVFDYNGDPLPGWPQPVENAIRAGLVAGDINNDGQCEVIGVDEKGVLYVWNANGTEYLDGDADPLTPGVFARFTGCIQQYSTPAVADIDFDGVNELVVGTQGLEVHVLNEDGSSVAGWPKPLGSAISGGVAVGDVDGDGGGDLELVVHESGGLTTAFHHDGSVLWTSWFPNYLSFGPSPALADLNNNGTLEAVIPSSNKKLYVIASNGGTLPGWPVVYSELLGTESSAVVADIDNDGSLDIVLGDESRFISAWDASGKLLDGFPLKTNDAVRATPTIADVDKDGDVDLVAAGWDKAVYVWDFPEMFNPRMAPWASFHANLFNDGNIHTELPTGISAVAFDFDVGGWGVSLRWHLPADAGVLFHIDRAVVERDAGGQTVGNFSRIASSRAVDRDGVLRYDDAAAVAGNRYVYRIESSSDESMNYTTIAVYVPIARAALEQNYPNPFNPVTRIAYAVPDAAPGRVQLVIYDVRGARVRGLVDEIGAGGRYVVEWDGRNDAGEAVGSGVYFYRLVQRNYVGTRKMVLLK